MASASFTSAFDLLGKSYNLIIKNWKVFAILYALPFLAGLQSSGMQLENRDASELNGVSDPSELIGVILAFLIFAPIFIAIFAVIYAMLLQLELDVAQDKTPTFGQVWQSLKPRFWKLLGLMFLIALMIVGGLILLIIPGLFVIQRYLLAPYFLLDKNLTIGEALRNSSAVAKKHSGPVWGVVGVLILFGIISSLPGLFGLVGFVLSALYSVAPAIRYLEVKKAS